MSLWVVGTDTAVGKSVVSALILLRHGATGKLAYWKPVSTGGETDRDRATLESWLSDAAGPVEILPETYHFDEPVSPHLAARLAGGVIEADRVLEDLVRHGLDDRERNLLIEAAGGLMVPLDEDGLLLVDLVAETALPVVLVTRSTLGTINHTLLSIEALRGRHIEIAGIVINGPPNRENHAAIEKWGKVPVIGTVPPLKSDWSAVQLSECELALADLEPVAATFDPENVLGRYLE